MRKTVVSSVITSLRKIKEGDDQRDRCDWKVVLIKAVSSGGDSGAEIYREVGNQLGDPSRAARGRKPGAQILVGGRARHAEPCSWRAWEWGPLRTQKDLGFYSKSCGSH